MFIKVMVFFLLASASVRAANVEKILNGYDPVADVLSDEYEAGPYLIYDCKNKHWVCVLKSYFDECASVRNKEQLDKIEKLSCAPVEEFLNKKSCFQKQLYLTTHGFGDKMCEGEIWIEKEIRL